MYAFVYALLIQVLELRTPKCDNLRTDGAPSGGRTHTGRILSPPRETPGFQNLEDLSVAQAQVLGILRDVYAFMYAFSIQTVAVSQLHKQLAETKDIEMARKANGQGHTYKVGNSYRTVIRKGDHCITITAGGFFFTSPIIPTAEAAIKADQFPVRSSSQLKNAPKPNIIANIQVMTITQRDTFIKPSSIGSCSSLHPNIVMTKLPRQN